ncbi:FERM domain-containing protein 6-like isoform X3 [Sebastes umbrosus]|uniref:FERM domain-containing protein 6-like isoform X3 n=1 Tax=Sebastes umbrosus TaxID=72105 RepID=UPI0018A0904B|nr:FERM domain-containing protein 6-like isoform X3 [Sebastes umbrosus]
MKTTQERHVCVLLPNKQHLDCTVRVRARGHMVLNSVLKQLGVSELQVFGLAALRDNEYLFLDLEKKISKYFGKRWNRGSLMAPFILFLRVQHYVESGRLILSSRVQQLYYAELRQKVLHSQSRHQEALFFQLAASALQAEVGDLEQRAEGDDEEEGEERKHRHYFLPEDYFPSWLIKRRGRDFLLQHCPVLHVELRGVTRSQAVLQFIKEAGNLQDGPVTFYRMRQEKKELRGSILLSVALKGVHIYQEVEGKLCLLYDFSWTNIDRLTFQVGPTCTPERACIQINLHIALDYCTSLSLALQGSRFEVAAVGSLCLSKLVYYTPSAFHSKHILKHLSDSHRLHISTRGAVSYIQQLEDMQGQKSIALSSLFLFKLITTGLCLDWFLILHYDSINILFNQTISLVKPHEVYYSHLQPEHFENHIMKNKYGTFKPVSHSFSFSPSLCSQSVLQRGLHL